MTRAYLEDLFAGLACPDAPGAVTYAVTDGGLSRDGVTLAHSVPVAAACDALVAALNEAAVAPSADHLLAHAGVVASGDRAVLLPGASGSGKTSLTIALVAAGLEYLSDETAAVAVRDLALLPYPKPLSVKAGAQPVFPELRPPPGSAAARCTGETWHVPADRVRAGAVARVTAYPAFVVAPRYVAGGRTVLEPASRAETMVTLGANSSYVGALGPALLDVLERIVRRAATYRLAYGDVHAARDAVLGLLG